MKSYTADPSSDLSISKTLFRCEKPQKASGAERFSMVLFSDRNEPTIRCFVKKKSIISLRIPAKGLMRFIGQFKLMVGCIYSTKFTHKSDC